MCAHPIHTTHNPHSSPSLSARYTVMLCTLNLVTIVVCSCSMPHSQPRFNVHAIAFELDTGRRTRAHPPQELQRPFNYLSMFFVQAFFCQGPTVEVRD